MESSAHDVVVVARQHGQARSRLPIPDADGLVVGRAHLNTKGKEKGKNKVRCRLVLYEVPFFVFLSRVTARNPM